MSENFEFKMCFKLKFVEGAVPGGERKPGAVTGATKKNRRERNHESTRGKGGRGSS